MTEFFLHAGSTTCRSPMEHHGLEDDFASDIAAVQRIAAVPSILDIVCRSTGLGFAAVARVTEDRWIACQVLDNIHFGLPPKEAKIVARPNKSDAESVLKNAAHP